MAISIIPEEIPNYVSRIVKAGKVPLTTGPPGLGKSWNHKLVADTFKLFFIDLRLTSCEPPDVNGLIAHKGNKSTYNPMDIFPLQDDPIPEGYEGWYICCDEFTSIGDDMQAAMYKLILDRMVGQHKLHPRCILAAAGNELDQGAIVHEMSSALASRFIHLHVRSDLKSFLKVSMTLDMDHRIRSFLNFKPSNLNNFSPDQLALEDTYACERTWHFLSDLMKFTKPDEKEALARSPAE